MANPSANFAMLPPQAQEQLSLALEAGRRGYCVIPVSGKRPLVRNWPNRASKDAQEIIQMFTEAGSLVTGYGIATGARSGIVVLDVDANKSGYESLASLGDLPQTLTHRTGGGGLHLIFKHPGWEVGNLVGVKPGLDVRGDGGQIVGPGSRHSNGTTYTVEPGVTEPADLPPKLLELFAKRSGEGSSLPGVIREGSRNDTLFRHAASLRGQGWEEDEIVETLLVANQNCRPPLGEQEVRSIAQSVMRYEGPTHWTEDSLARQITEEHGAKFRFVGQKCWVWDGGRWLSEPAEKTLIQVVREKVRGLQLEASSIPDAKIRNQKIKEARAFETNNRITGIRRLVTASPELEACAEDFDRDPFLLNVENGTVDLRTGELGRGLIMA